MREFLNELEELGVNRNLINDMRARFNTDRTEPAFIDQNELDQAEVFFGEQGQDHLYGNSGNDSLRSLSGDDILVDQQGNNEFLGGMGNDILIAGNGNDIIDGETGNDFLKTGGGNDLLRFRGIDNENYITDFDRDNDRLEFIDFNRDNLEIGRHQETGSIMITAGDDFQVVFLNEKGNLTLSDFNITTPTSQTQTLFDPGQDGENNDDIADNDDISDDDISDNNDNTTDTDIDTGTDTDTDTDTDTSDNNSGGNIHIKDASGNTLIDVDNITTSQSFNVPASDPNAFDIDVNAPEHMSVKITYIAPDGSKSVIFDSENGGRIINGSDQDDILVSREADEADIGELMDYINNSGSAASSQTAPDIHQDNGNILGTSGDDVIIMDDNADFAFSNSDLFNPSTNTIANQNSTLKSHDDDDMTSLNDVSTNFANNSVEHATVDDIF